MSVYFYGCVTLDGYLADKNHGLSWLHETGATGETSYEQFYQRMDVTLMGRRTFREIEKVEDSGSIYPTTENYVFTHDTTLKKNGYIPVARDVTEFVRELGEGKNIWVVGGNTLLAPLLGKGVPLFTQPEDVKRFCLRGIEQYGQFAELRYSRK